MASDNGNKKCWYPWYPGDWKRDTAVQNCPFYAKEIWREMLDLMHDGEPYGFLTAGGRPITDPGEIASMIGGITAKQVARALEELGSRHVYSTTADGVIFSRRMVKDEGLRKIRGDHGGESCEHPDVPKRKADKDTLPADGKDTLGGPEDGTARIPLRGCAQRPTRARDAFAESERECAGAPTPGGVTFAAVPKAKKKRERKCHPEAHAFVEWFRVEYPNHRNGAPYLPAWARDTQIASDLLGLYALERLQKLTVMLWGAAGDTEWKTRDTDRSIPVLRANAMLLDGILRQHERRAL